jgi:hypothetical protein
MMESHDGGDLANAVARHSIAKRRVGRAVVADRRDNANFLTVEPINRSDDAVTN